MRKLFDLAPDMLNALKLFAQDSGRSFDDLAEEAFALLLRKHCRPRGLQQALLFSLRSVPRNDNRSVEKQAR
jgi:hypothetical protein